MKYIFFRSLKDICIYKLVALYNLYLFLFCILPLMIKTWNRKIQTKIHSVRHSESTLDSNEQKSFAGNFWQFTTVTFISSGIVQVTTLIAFPIFRAGDEISTSSWAGRCGREWRFRFVALFTLITKFEVQERTFTANPLTCGTWIVCVFLFLMRPWTLSGGSLTFVWALPFGVLLFFEGDRRIGSFDHNFLKFW